MLKRVTALAAWSMLITHAAHAQSSPPNAVEAPASSALSSLRFVGDATVDSAAVARAAFRDATRAPSRELARNLLVRAAFAWPTQSAYWIQLAHVAAQLSDTANVVSALERLAAMRIGGDIVNDSAIVRLGATGTVRSARERLISRSADFVAGHVVATLADSTVFAEGIDVDVRTGELYVASVKHRTVFAINARGRVRDLGLARHAFVGSVFGVRVAPDGRSLFLTTATHAVSAKVTAALLQVRASDGALLGRWPLPDSTAEHMPGDLALAADGTVFVSDSFSPHVFQFNVTRHAWTTFSDLRFRSLQGIAPIDGTTEVIVADYSHGLFVLDRASGVIHQIAAPDSLSVLGLDGLVWDGARIVAVQNGVDPARIVRVSFDAARTRVTAIEILDQQPRLADQPTIGTRRQSAFYYVANSQWNQYDDRGARVSGTVLAPTRIMCVSLGTGGKTCPAVTPPARTVRMKQHRP